MAYARMMVCSTELPVLSVAVALSETWLASVGWSTTIVRFGPEPVTRAGCQVLPAEGWHWPPTIA